MNAGNNVSRRKMLAMGASLAAMPALGAAAVSGKLAAGTNSKVRLIEPGSPEFLSKIELHYPGLLSDAHFKQIQPLAVLLSHDEGPKVHAYSLVYSLTTSGGEYKTALFSYAHAGSRMHRSKAVNAAGKKLRTRTVFSAQTHILKAGDLVLATPFVTMSPKQYTQLRESWFLRINTSQPGVFLFADLPQATSTKVSLDAVVFRNRVVTGPDTYHLRRRLAIRRNAEHDVALKHKKMLKSGLDIAAVQSSIESEATSLRTAPSGSAQDLYLQARKRHAQFLLSLQNAVPHARFQKALHRMTKLHKTKLKAVAS